MEGDKEIDRLGLEDPKMMVFCESVEEANEMAELLGGKSYHSYSEDNEQILSDLKSGKIKVVTARDKFNEGVDVPDVEVIAFLRATKSGPLFEQQLGRGLRKIAGKDRVYVLDFVANIERIAKVRELSELVQRHAHECGDEEALEEPMVGEGGGITVHSKHSEFDFASVAVNLLERYASLSSNSLKQKSNEEIIELALSLSPKAAMGRHAVAAFSSKGDFISPDQVRSRFGTFAEFQKACGFEPLREMPKKEAVERDIDIEGMIALAKEVSPDLPLSAERIKELSESGRFVSIGKIYKYFGSIPDFQNACGFETADRKKIVTKLSNSEIIALAKELKPDAPLTSKEIKELPAGSFVSYSFLMKRFGSAKDYKAAWNAQATDS